MAVQAVPGYNLQPSAQQVPLATNYIKNFDFLNQYLPDTYEKEFERYGNRTVSSFLRMVGAEMPSNSDLIKWAEQGRLHTKYVNCTSPVAIGAAVATFTVNDVLDPAFVNATTGSIAIRKGQTVMITDNAGGTNNKAIVTAVNTAALTFTVAFYEAAGAAVAGAAAVFTVFIYGSEFKKGTNGMEGSLDADDIFFENSPIIIKDKYSVSGSDMAQIGWVEIATEDGGTGYLWYMKSEHVSRLDKQGSIEENVIFCDRAFSFGIDDMLANVNGSSQFASDGASYGLFENDRDMALNLGFSGFRRGYDFYKSDWKYLNDPTMRGGLPTAAGSGKVNGMLVPAGSTTVYDQILGKNAKRPFLHVRYRASETEDRRYKTWITGSAGGAENSDLDAMEVNFLSERAVCTLGANNFFLFQN